MSNTAEHNLTALIGKCLKIQDRLLFLLYHGHPELVNLTY